MPFLYDPILVGATARLLTIMDALFAGTTCIELTVCNRMSAIKLHKLASYTSCAITSIPLRSGIHQGHRPAFWVEAGPEQPATSQFGPLKLYASGIMSGHTTSKERFGEVSTVSGNYVPIHGSVCLFDPGHLHMHAIVDDQRSLVVPASDTDHLIVKALHHTSPHHVSCLYISCVQCCWAVLCYARLQLRCIAVRKHVARRRSSNR